MHSCGGYSYKRLKLAQFLGQLGVFLTFWAAWTTCCIASRTFARMASTPPPERVTDAWKCARGSARLQPQPSETSDCQMPKRLERERR